MPEPMQKEWRRYALELMDFPQVSFPRSVVPKNPVGKPEILGFFDGSSDAYSAKVDVRWKCQDGTWHVELLCAKARVSPVQGLSIPRAELNGLLLLTRMVENAVTAMSVKPSRITLCGDSTCTISSLDATASVLNVYFFTVCQKSRRLWTSCTPVLRTRSQFTRNFPWTLLGFMLTRYSICQES